MSILSMNNSCISTVYTTVYTTGMVSGMITQTKVSIQGDPISANTLLL